MQNGRQQFIISIIFLGGMLISCQLFSAPSNFVKVPTATSSFISIPAVSTPVFNESAPTFMATSVPTLPLISSPLPTSTSLPTFTPTIVPTFTPTVVPSPTFESTCEIYADMSTYQICVDRAQWRWDAKREMWVHKNIPGCAFQMAPPHGWGHSTRTIKLAGMQFLEGRIRNGENLLIVLWGPMEIDESNYFPQNILSSPDFIPGVRFHIEVIPAQVEACKDSVYSLINKTLMLRDELAQACDATKDVYLARGEKAIALDDVAIYSAPRWEPKPQSMLAKGETITLLDGPRCALSPYGVLVLWYARLNNGKRGWVPEGLARGHSIDVYYLQSPNHPAPVSQEHLWCDNAPSSPLEVGMRAYVCTKSDGVFVRAVPGRRGRIIASVQPGTELEIISGPECGDGWVWWRVRLANGLEGWMAEGGDNVDPKFLCPKK